MSEAVLEIPAVKKSNHRANVVRITEILPHSNADKLELIHIDGYQCVVGKGQFKVGDLAVYIQPDSVVPQTKPFAFIWGPYQDPSDPVGLDQAKAVPERRRRITVRKFRGEWSEGLLLSVEDFPKLTQHNGIIDVVTPTFSEGTDVSDILGITHWNPDVEVESNTRGTSTSAAAPRRKYPKTFRGWLYFLLAFIGFGRAKKLITQEVSFKIPTYDVEALKNHMGAFQDGEPVLVTEKIHGSNARFICIDGVMYAGSRNLWKSPDSDCIWRKALAQNPWIEAWCRAHKGFALYGEVAPTQKGFHYGLKDGEVRFWVFDILSPAGEWLSPEEWYTIGLITPEKGQTVPVLYAGPFDKEQIFKLVDGPSLIPGANHIREGIVIKAIENRNVRGLGRLQLKVVSNAFLERDSK
jgi:tRNA-binding EMAP/Myf-like protein